ncbi:class I SAM-dependent methyltransferase [Parasporobacterium paucivorans]|uniref:Methyltransferase domain-containing protein n=1 Tax=Parasporobacterium paucivorans DSM 15970 TaxID=1122934 RepID=A0A1M6EKF3_9FIRM|nr:class I SAM-dependent methyltransferase [Parasporobacterium paucivorans]SHI85909.1 Methyltransferase domain-containing protein [Parasporobacterium paucivorans DSM 15970]
MWRDAKYWEEEWTEAYRRSIYRRQRISDNTSWWDKRAPGFAARTEDKSKNDSILNQILATSFIDKSTDLLDIGCGTGNYAIPLSSRFRKIVALDSSPVMLSILKKRAEAMNIHNIETVCMAWDDIYLNEMDWMKKFGLVIAIKTPGISNAETLEKMCEASSHGCFYNGFISKYDMDQQELWRIIFDEEKPEFPSDPFYIFHLLYAWGYLPSMDIKKIEKSKKMKISEATENLQLMMKNYKDLPDSTDRIVEQYVKNNAFRNEFISRGSSVEGNVIWSV